MIALQFLVAVGVLPLNFAYLVLQQVQMKDSALVNLGNMDIAHLAKTSKIVEHV